MSKTKLDTLLSSLKFNDQGLIPAIAQDNTKGDILMMAWMNKEAIEKTLSSGRVCYWSRSRQALWKKGETSGQHQDLVDLIIDCDRDTILVKVKQNGVACHTGRRSCFYTSVSENGDCTEISNVEIDPKDLYGNKPS
ncbi:phosphoribosyl-AMP cyclohydrolase [Kiloniella litopenaei]|uniref:Phosphoribosyl-AMP cyclohydrolase n=1 Tax=Kiloniella litopenaei TaxID=1549748 RepID=A0A0M2R0U8_9PROT|nr:phosphoribosyl-AMP cyclohydrolase [Kiloniella litopenaei]KKJ75522.1 phosphoribosyl-AMP cyclohydrolase [Kiloniella litopenaei]